MIPFSKRNRTTSYSEFVIFYENDTCFADILRDPSSFEADIARFPGMVSTMLVPSLLPGRLAADLELPTVRTESGRWWKGMDEKIREQILAIRDTGLTNMFDVPMVQRLAYDRDLYELVLWLEDHRIRSTSTSS